MKYVLQACAACACLSMLSPSFARAQELADAGDTGTDTPMPAITVVGQRSYEQRHALPPSAAGIAAPAIADKINVMNTEDALKYLPDLLVRKRYIGDTNAPLATRTTGINASARTLIYADGLLLSSLIANNNGNGSPQWFIVAPNEIRRIDVLYGPYLAMYPGNSYGAVVNITTRMPTEFETGGKVSTSFDDFSQYGTRDDFRASEISAGVGDRNGAFAWRLSINHLDSRSQPVTYLTLAQSSAPPTGTAVSGAYADKNRNGGAIQVIGAGNLTHTLQDNATLKLAYDFSDTLRAAYTAAYWQNDADLLPQTYLRDAGGAPYFGATSGNVDIGGFSYSANSINATFNAGSTLQRHLAQALSLVSATQTNWDWLATAAHFDYLKDQTRTSTAAFPAGAGGGTGRIVDAGGTGWDTLDARADWRPQGFDGMHFASFGAHGDRYVLDSPTFAAADWKYGGQGAQSAASKGRTETGALWAQDLWRLMPTLAATAGLRYENWRAYAGSIATSGALLPALHKDGVSPKLMLAWDAAPQWQIDLSAGRALRFPTAGELYQGIAIPGSTIQPNPNLKPEGVRSAELAGEWHVKDAKLRLTVFEEHVRDALISQTSTPSGGGAPVSFTQNVDRTRQRGVELSGEAQNLGLQGFELTGNITYVDARIKQNSGYSGTGVSVGKTTPYVPRLRSTLAATYKPDERWAYTLAGRYSSRLFASVDNTDINTHTYQGFDSYFVADARVNCRISKQWGVAAGVNNLLNREYFLFHPFEQRSFFAELKYDL